MLGRRLWKVGGFLALGDVTDVAGRAAVRVYRIRPVRDQATGFDVVAVVVDRGQLVPGRKRDDQVAINQRQRAPRHDQAAIWGMREGRNSAFDLAGIEHVDRLNSTPNDGDTDWRAHHWPFHEAMDASRM